jgi:hypothetical protein
MNLTSIQTYFLNEIEKTWKSLRTPLPWGVWIREYKNINNTSGEDFYKNTPRKVWFLDKNGFLSKEANDFQRLLVIHSQQFWCKRSNWTEPSPVFGRRHELGFCAFGKIVRENNSYYFDYQFGGLYGEGCKYVFDDSDEIVSKERIWVS